MLFSMLAVSCASEPVRVVQQPAPRPDPHMLPDDAFRAMNTIAGLNGSNSEKLSKIQAVVCDGSKPRFSIRRTLEYIPPNTAGLPIDEALRWKKLHAEGARKFLKEKYFYFSGQKNSDASQPEDADEPASQKEIEKADREAYWHGNSSGGDFRLEQTYEARFLKTAFLHKGGYPDMQFLFDVYTFRIPVSVFDQTKHIPLWYLGYEGKNDVFSASNAMKNRNDIWNWVAERSTSLAEAATDSSTIRYGVEFKFDLFCKYAIPVTDLESK